MIKMFKITTIAILTFTTFAQAQNRTPDFSFSLGKTNYFILETKGKAKAKNDTAFYNLYRLGKTQAIAKEIKSVVNKTTKDTLKSGNYEVAKNSISFYIMGKKQPVVERVYTQNLKGLLSLKTIVTDYKSAGMGVVEVPPATHSVVADRQNNPLIEVDVLPEFPGGMIAVRKYIANNLQYPDEAQEEEVEGTVRAKFIVEVDGSVTNIQIETKLGYGCDEEVIRVLRKMPKWKPGELNGKPVRTYFRVPVTFKLQ
ncbi:energy transducer TonB [Pedobacter cryotolerans]|uniref:Energy transducer TonB n=2 Tax=Pedobacter cryotolerans TaxID=2571270 RepID=A0A4U1CA17_9SPHI|nr:energy transducer TonB [Pedobacter cryotolerans]